MPRMFFGTAVFHLAHFCQHLFRTLLMSAWAQTWAWSSSWWAKWVFRPSLLPPKKWELEKALFFHKPTCNFPGLKNLKNEGKNHFFWPRLPKFTRGKNIDFFSDFENVERKPFLHLSWVINFWGQLVAENSLNDDGSEKWTNLEIESISLRSKHQQRCYSQ